jgi:DNA-binding MarR family transcriptional regulator
MPPDPVEAPDARDAWHALLQVSSRMLREFDRRLDRTHGIGIREFDVLITLDRPNGGLRMTELANAVMVTSGGLTRLVGRLEERGLVRREKDADDGRSFHALLTDAGRVQLAAARTTHDAVIGELLGSRLSDAEVRRLTTILRRTLDGVRER